MKTTDKDRSYLGRNGSRDLEVVRAYGSYVYDEKGRRYIDFFMGWSVGTIGWNLDEITKKVKLSSVPTYVAPGYRYRPWADLAELLATIAPGQLVKTFRATGGTEAVEIALQAAMTHTGRSKFISVEQGYHGHSLGALSIGSSENRKRFKNLLAGCYKVAAPLDEVAARKVIRLLKKRDIAAFISEPVICSLGAEVPTKQFWNIVAAGCRKYGTLLIADEVATGFGHTGKLFACEHYDLKPDILCFAKAVGGGYGALGGTMMTPSVARSFETRGDFYSTFGWHPINAELVLASLRHFLKNKRTIFANATKLSRYFEKRLQSMKFRHDADIRMKGLVIAVRFKSRTYAAEILGRALQGGLLVANARSKDFIMFPSLTMSLKTAKEGLDILEACL